MRWSDVAVGPCGRDGRLVEKRTLSGRFFDQARPERAIAPKSLCAATTTGTSPTFVRHPRNKGMTGSVERRSFLRGSGPIPSSGQGAGGGDRRPRGVFGLRPSPGAGLLPIRPRPSRPSPDREWRLGGRGLSHDHQCHFLNRGLRWPAGSRVSGWERADLRHRERAKDQQNVLGGTVARFGVVHSTHTHKNW